MPPSLRLSPRVARLGCEILEGRTLLSTMGVLVPPPAAPLVVGHAPLNADRVTHALDQLDKRLLTEPVGATSQAPLTVDLNQDGIPDTISLWQPPRTTREVLRVVYGASPGAAPLLYETVLDHLVSRLIVADFDGDGRLDLFAQQGSAGTGTLLLGNGDGTFDAYRQGGKHYSLAVGNLSPSSVDPFVYASNEPLPVLIDRGVGTYAPQASSPRLPATDVQFANLSGSGTTDLAITEGDGSVWMYAGQGAGKFSSTPYSLENLFAGDGTVHVAFANLVGPSRSIPPGIPPLPPLDMVIASTALSKVAVFLNQGNGSMRQGQVMPVGLAPSAITVADINGDSLPDLIVTCAGSNSVWIFKGLGNGQFDDVHPEILATGADSESTFVGYFSDPHQVGLVTLNRQANSLTYYANAANPSSGQQISSGGTGPSAALVRDVNQDGYSDLIVANRDDGRVTLFQGGKDGLHETQTIDRPGTHPSALATGPGLQSPYQFYVLDDGSGQAEILSFNPLPPSSEVTEQAGPPDLEPASTVTIQLQLASETTADLVPTLLSSGTEHEMQDLMFGSLKSSSEATLSSGDGAILEDDTSGAAEKAKGRLSDESLAAGEGDSDKVERYLLGVDDVPPPPLKGAGADTPMVPARQNPSPEPIAQATRLEEKDLPITEGKQKQEEPSSETPEQGMPAKKIETLHMEDLVLGVVVLFGPMGLHEMSRKSRTPWIIADMRKETSR